MAVSKLQQQNIAAAAAYTEYSFNVPPSVNGLTLALRFSNTPANIFWYMVSTPNVGNNSAGLPALYNTIPMQNNRTIQGRLGGQTVYFQVDQATQVLEVDYFSDV